MVAPILHVDSESTIRGIDIDLNVAPDIDVVGYLDAKNGSSTSQPDGGDTCLSKMSEMSYRVDLQNRQCDCRRFQTLHYPFAHVVAACAKVSLNVEQFVDNVYTLKCTLRVWENEFPVLLDLSTWEVPSTTFELVPEKGWHRNLKGYPQSS
ncbi:hypothetical protein PVK06_002366 [Gossypium arboreum]|uniref:SWIM-type domain-containing protein n=1 Tax=Gossypium arboreum TaxID=29729 RepID=A0ABR0R3M6_GOSAR|nr:hypothetical protein PVK06_002366 [Gossypium arboreum]